MGPTTTLKQLVEQYDNALKRKIENETKADFNSFNSTIPVITCYGCIYWQALWQEGSARIVTGRLEAGCVDILVLCLSYSVELLFFVIISFP